MLTLPGHALGHGIHPLHLFVEVGVGLLLHVQQGAHQLDPLHAAQGVVLQVLAVGDVGDAQLVQLGQHLVAAVHGVGGDQDDLGRGGADELIVGGGVLAHIGGGAVLNLLGNLLDMPFILVGGHQTHLVQRPDGVKQGGVGGGEAAQLGQRGLENGHVPRVVRRLSPPRAPTGTSVPRRR